jgi:hypothetical protein
MDGMVYFEHQETVQSLVRVHLIFLLFRVHGLGQQESGIQVRNKTLMFSQDVYYGVFVNEDTSQK